MSTKYYGERITADAAKALLVLVKNGFKLISDLTENLQKQNFDISNEQTRRKARHLRAKDYLSGSAKDGYEITQKGLKALEALKLQSVEEPELWDGIWRFMMFDIPEDKRKLRNAIRDLVKKLGCHQLQQSVWVHPFPCFEQFRSICQTYGDLNDIVLVEAKTIEGGKDLQKIFSKQFPRAKFL